MGDAAHRGRVVKTDVDGGAAGAPAALLTFGAGLLFAIGLGLSGMTRADKVIGFLDVFGPFGRWDPSLLFVMGGALAVNLVLFPIILRRRAPLFGELFALPRRRDLNAGLVVGAALFGVGWGLSGYCPGPALMSLPSLTPEILVFGAALLLGTIGHDQVREQLDRRTERQTGHEVVAPVSTCGE